MGPSPVRIARAALALGIAAAAAASPARAGDEPAAAPITAIAFAPDGDSVVTGSGAGVRALRWPDLERRREIPCEIERVHDLGFAPGGDRLAIAGGSPAESGRIELRRWPGGELIASARVFDDVIYALAFSPDGARLAVAGHGAAAAILDAETGAVRHLLAGHSRPVLAADWIDGGRAVVTAGADASVRLWDAESGAARRSLDNHTAAVTSLAARPLPPGGGGGPPLLASAGEDDTVRFWQPTVGRLVRFARLPAAPAAIAWTDGGRWLLAACRDGRLRAIDPEAAAVVLDAPIGRGRPHALAVAPRGDVAVAGGEGGLSIISILSLTDAPARATGPRKESP